MTLSIDPEIRAVLGGPSDGPTPPVGDVDTRRRNLATAMAKVAAAQEAVPGVARTDHLIPSFDGAQIRASWYRSSGAELPTSAVLFLHGGAMILPLLPVYDGVARAYVKATGVPMLLVDYRVAPEHPHPAPVEDSYAALRWLAEHATELSVDPNRIAVMGDSAGGGLAAGVALLARDRSGPAVAEQLLIYAMLDDRTMERDRGLPVEYITFGYDDNRTGWGALLADAVAGDQVSAYAAPARAVNLAGLPRTYLEVGDLDILRDENVEYARRLIAAGVQTELHVIAGLPHGFDLLAPNARVTRLVMANRLHRLRDL
jgi:acetyl esterase/lipase